MKDLSLFIQPSRRTILLIAVVFVLVFGGLLTFFLWATPGQSTSSSKATPIPSSDMAPSPLLFGTNLLLNQQEQALSSSQMQTLLKQTQVRIVRFPASTISVPEAKVVSVASAVQQVGAVPLVVLPATTSNDAASKATIMVKDMNRIFGQSRVYYEYGNEDDIAGTSATQYATAWNAQVPALKHLATNGKFLGPVTYQYDQAYLTTFLQMAQPRPDAISWHEYPCDASSPTSTCLAHLADWSLHIGSARRTMQAILKSSLPIMITEWNYAPNVTSQDQKGNDASFVKSWTAQALQTLARNQVYASMQYSLLGPSTALIASNKSMTPQGATFQQLYGSMIVAHQPTPMPTPMGTPTPTPTDTPTPTLEATPTPTLAAMPILATTPILTIVPTPTATPMPIPTAVPTPIPTPTAVPTPTLTPFTWTSEAEGGSNTLIGASVKVSCPTCSGGWKIGGLGNNSGELQFNNIVVSGTGNAILTIYYCSAEIRDAWMSVDGGAGMQLIFSNSGGWFTPSPLTVSVRLNAGSNTIKFYNSSGWAPDLDRIVLHA